MRTVAVLRSIAAVLVTSLILGSPAFAQTTSPPPDGITVFGLGLASAPADSSTIQITVSSNNYAPPMGTRPGATPGAEEREAVQPIVDSLLDTGLAEADITVTVPPFLGNSFSGPFGPASALIELTLDDPTSESIEEIINAASVGGGESGLVIGGVNVVHHVQDCNELRREAQQAAFNDATEQASIEAEIVGVTLGDVVAVRDVMYGPGLNADPFLVYTDDDSCSFSTSNVYGAYGPVPYDVASEPLVTVYATTEVTFEFGSGMAATPAS